MSGQSVLCAAVAALGTVSGYTLLCLVAPFGTCRRCLGEAGRPGTRGRVCRRCKGTGRRLRLGRRVINYLREARRDADRARTTTRNR